MRLNSALITNFQSHGSTLIEFSPSFTVIVGASNSGKTSILRSVRWVSDNRPLGDSIIKHLVVLSSVYLSVTDDDKKIEIVKSRDKKGGKYSLAIDGGKFEDFTAFGKSVPKEISDILNLSDVNLQSQLSPHFLVLETPGKVAQYINELVDLDTIDKVIKVLTTDLRKIDAEIEVLGDEAAGIDAGIADIGLLELDTFKLVLDAADGVVADTVRTVESIHELAQLIMTIEATEKQLVEFTEEDEQLRVSIEESLIAHQEVSLRFNDLTVILLGIAGIHIVDITEDDENLRTSIDELLEERAGIVAQHAALKAILTDIESIHVVEFTEEDESLRQEVEQLTTEYGEVSNRTYLLSVRMAEIANAQSQLDVYAEQTIELTSAKEAILAKLENCPLCEQTLGDGARDALIRNSANG